jgi:ribonuclease HII
MPRNIRADSPPLFPVAPGGPDFTREARLLAKGCGTVAGVDEAGRGPLAGPVVAAAVILDPARIPDGLHDAKQLTTKARERLFEAIALSALAIAIASANAETIDATNILAATMEAMARAVAALGPVPGHALIDGNRLPAALPCPATAVVGGDALSLSIAAASIVAKVTRDAMMERAGTVHPAFGFGRHKGYGGSAEHRDAIATLGGVPRLHRFTFAPLKERR